MIPCCIMGHKIMRLGVGGSLTRIVRSYKPRRKTVVRWEALWGVHPSQSEVRLLSAGVYVVMHNRALKFPGVVKDRVRMTFARR